MPKYNNVNNTAAAFCSNHEMIKDKGNLFTSQLKALDKATATSIAE